MLCCEGLATPVEATDRVSLAVLTTSVQKLHTERSQARLGTRRGTTRSWLQSSVKRCYFITDNVNYP